MRLKLFSATVAPAAVLALFWLVAGCGGGDGGSRERFAREGNAICRGANAKVRRLGREPPILTAEQADWLEQLTAIDRSAVQRLRALEPPEGNRTAIAAMLSAFDRGLARGAAIARASRAGHDAAFRANVGAALVALGRAQQAAADNGLDECALLGRVAR